MSYPIVGGSSDAERRLFRLGRSKAMLGPMHDRMQHMMSISEQVLTTLAEVAQLDEVKVNLDIKLYETHVLDSISTVELILALSDRLGVEISPAELDHEQWATPRKMVQYFEARIAQ